MAPRASDTIAAIATNMKTSKADAQKFLDALGAYAWECSASQTEFKIGGIGTFKPFTRAARKGRNPATGEAVDIAAKGAVKFKADSALTGAITA